mgnify:CR=1 FL=1
MIRSKKLLKQKKISHAFFDKNGGKSNGIYKSLNCGLGSSDKKSKVIKNLRIAKDKINDKAKDIFLVHQIHSSKYIFLNKNFRSYKKKVKADAIITNQKNLPIAVLTADCVPILLFDKKKDMVAAIHAGWKGAINGIVKNVINFMFKKGCKSNNIIAAVGPCIKQNSYNVKEDFKNKFIKKDKKNKVFFKKKKDILYFDLTNFVKLQLKLNGITKIDIINLDTFNKRNNFFSARRSLSLKQDDYGRNISIIMIN